MRETVDRLKPLFTDKPPVENPPKSPEKIQWVKPTFVCEVAYRERSRPKIPERIQWVKPELVCEVSFAKWTSDGQMRQTTFLGLRSDKNPKEVVLELAPETI